MLDDFDRFSKNPQILHFIKIPPVVADFFYADRQTDMPKQIVVFRNFANETKIDFLRQQILNY
jgi:hypothetical protein